MYRKEKCFDLTSFVKSLFIQYLHSFLYPTHKRERERGENSEAKEKRENNWWSRSSRHEERRDTR